ncbi:DUF4209 domain-containing protein [Bacillus proteolyticus]|uniref:DUF4209 domain-containing protein n=1 Tax=Bacillus proteolyticus TaxID=2026192 RepID=UPI003CFD7AB1
MGNLWKKVNAIEYDVQDWEVYSTIRNELNRILEEIEEDTEGYFEVHVLKEVCSLFLDLDDSEEPYKPQIVLNDGRRSVSLEDFNDDMKRALISIIKEDYIESPFILFRVMDVHFILNRDYSIKKGLFLKLMELIDYCYSNNKYHLTTEFLNRGFQLFGPESKKKQQLIEKLDSIISSINVSNPLDNSIQSFMHQLFKLIEKYQYIKNEKHPGIGVEIAKGLEEANEFDAAIEWWGICKKLFNRNKQFDCASKCIKNQALAHYTLAEKELQKEKVNYFLVVHRLNLAILSLRNVKGNENLVKEWIRQKNDYQKKSLDHLSSMEFPVVDISMDLENIEKMFVNKNPMQILWLIGALAKPLDYKDHFKWASENKSVAEIIFPIHKMDEEGKTIHISQDDAEFPKSLVMLYDQHYERVAKQILHSVNLLQQQYFIKTDDLLIITEQNVFIPNGREVIVARALREGLKNNFVACLSILLPQFENSIRFLLRENGESLTSMAENTIEEEKTLSTLLENQKLEELLGINVVKDLQHLLVNKGGKNIRNKLAHGLMSPAEFHSSAAVYTFGLILHIIFHLKLVYI